MIKKYLPRNLLVQRQPWKGVLDFKCMQWISPFAILLVWNQSIWIIKINCKDAKRLGKRDLQTEFSSDSTIRTPRLTSTPQKYLWSIPLIDLFYGCRPNRYKSLQSLPKKNTSSLHTRVILNPLTITRFEISWYKEKLSLRVDAIILAHIQLLSE